MTSNNTTTRTPGDVHESVASGREHNTILPTQPESPALVDAEASQAAPEASQTATLPRLSGKKRKEMTPRSHVWGHFEKIVKNGVLKAECNHCKSIFAYSSGTSSLNSHLKICKALHKLDSTQTELVLNSGEAGGIGVWKLDQAAGRKALARMIVVDELPFKFVQKEGFVDYSSTISPNFKIPSRFTIARDIFQLYEQERSCLKDSLLGNGQRICVTTDTWTSNQNMSYMSLTAHYIDDKWRLNKKVLSFCPITSHTGEGIGKAVEHCLLQWGIEKVFTVTVDNASANDVALDYLKKKIKNWGNSVLECKWLHMRCMAHIINLVVVDGLKQQEAQDALKKIRHLVKHVKKSPKRLAKFKTCAERAKIQSKALLCLDVSTRWNLTYLMLQAAEKYETAFETYVDDDRELQTELLDMGCGFLEAEDWAIVRRVLAFFEKFYIMTVTISGSAYVTSNLFFDEVIQLHDWLTEWGRSNDTLFRSMAARMYQKY